MNLSYDKTPIGLISPTGLSRIISIGMIWCIPGSGSRYVVEIVEEATDLIRMQAGETPVGSGRAHRLQPIWTCMSPLTPLSLPTHPSSSRSSIKVWVPWQTTCCCFIDCCFLVIRNSCAGPIDFIQLSKPCLLVWLILQYLSRRGLDMALWSAWGSPLRWGWSLSRGHWNGTQSWFLSVDSNEAGVVNADGDGSWWIPSSVGCAKGCYMAESDIW